MKGDGNAPTLPVSSLLAQAPDLVHPSIVHILWVTIYIRRSRVPLPEIYSSIPEALHIAYVDETEVEVVSALGGVEVGWIAVLPGPAIIWEIG